MISQLFALPLRALVVAAILPIPPALGSPVAGPRTLPPAETIVSFADRDEATPRLRTRAHSTPTFADAQAGPQNHHADPAAFRSKP